MPAMEAVQNTVDHQQSLLLHQQEHLRRPQAAAAAAADSLRTPGASEGGMSTAQGCTCKLGCQEPLTQVHD